MEVEVVLGQVRERGDREPDPVGAVQGERVRGDLHRAGAVAAVDHPPERLLQVDRLRGRPLNRLLGPRHDPLDGPQQAGLNAGVLEDLTNQERGRRLPVRAGDAEHPQLRRRIAVEADRRVRHRRAGVRDLGLDDPGLELEAPLDDHGDRAGLHRERGELVPVGREAGGCRRTASPGRTPRLS